jgi:HD-GYP domain-containing protein (c-di-GMP phosphodiesterase class II)
VWLENDEGWVVARALHGYSDEQRERVSRRRVERDRARAVAGGAEPFVLGPAQMDLLAGGRIDPHVSYAVAPLAVAGRVGSIVAVLPPGEFGERELRLLGGLAHQAKLAIANASSFEGLERTFVSTVEALANALEANDEYTSTHARWITDLSLRVGRELGLEDATLKRLELGALLHDIGKIGIPSDILSKPGRLTADERHVMESHPALGERIIAPIDRLQEVCPIVRACHERWDGRGYPDGLAGEAIPPLARIVAVAEVYDTLTSGEEPASSFQAVLELRRVSGTQLDAACVEALARLLAGRDAAYRHAATADLRHELALGRRVSEAGSV